MKLPAFRSPWDSSFWFSESILQTFTCVSKWPWIFKHPSPHNRSLAQPDRVLWVPLTLKHVNKEFSLDSLELNKTSCQTTVHLKTKLAKYLFGARLVPGQCLSHVGN